MDSNTARELALASFENSKELLNSADIVFKDGNIGHAFGLLTLASEEIAKTEMCLDVADGRKKFVKKRKDSTSHFISKADLSNHLVKDEKFAEMIIMHILAPLILMNFIVFTRVDELGWEYFNPESYEEYAQYFTNMDPGKAADILDPTGKSSRKMDILVTLAVRLGKDKNDGFYADLREGKIISPKGIRKEEYQGLLGIINQILPSTERRLKSDDTSTLGKTFSEDIRETVKKRFGKDIFVSKPDNQEK